MYELMRTIWSEDRGQDIAEYAVMLAVILVLVVGTIRLVGGNANNAGSTNSGCVTTPTQQGSAGSPASNSGSNAATAQANRC